MFSEHNGRKKTEGSLENPQGNKGIKEKRKTIEC